MLAQNTFIFPYTILPESFYRFIALALPAVKILRVMRPAYTPIWNSGEFEEYPVFQDQEMIKKIQEIYRGYQEYAKIHGEKHLLETLSLAKEDPFWEESKFHLRTMIKYRDQSEPTDETIANIEAAIIIELARDLDKKDIELDADLLRIDSLENKFREALGLDDETVSELDEPMKITAESLPRRSYFGYLTKKRISSWLRLFLNSPTSFAPFLLCITEDIVEEIFDPIRTKIEKEGHDWIMKQFNIISIPNVLDLIEKKEFLKIKTEALSFDRVSLWEELNKFLMNPQEEDAFNLLKLHSEKYSLFLRDTIKPFCKSFRVDVPSIHLTAIYSPYVSLSEVIKYFTKKEGPWEFDNPMPFLVISENKLG